MLSNRIFQMSVLAALAASPRLLLPQDMPGMAGMSGMEHHHHDDAPTDLEKLGQVHFPVSCEAKTQAPFERGIALLHSFGYVEAERQFREIAASDPGCAMAHWGIAMSQYHELWGRPDAAAIKTGAEEMAKAVALAGSSKLTPREKAYIDALHGFFEEAPKDFQTAADQYAAAMGTLHKAYPRDIEGAAFYALAVIASEAPDDTSLNKERTALAVLVPLFQQNPHHPGLAHYIIHTCDTPALAAQGLEAAKVYAAIAPSSPHALHMPGHIFARLGMWPEDIQSNLASVAASEKAEAAGQPGVAHQMHADEFLIYAYLQVGEDEKARTLTSKMQAIGQHVDSMPGMDDMKGSGPWFANELNAIYLLEMHDWKAAEKLKPEAKSPEDATGDITWANGIAAGHLRDAKAAKKALAIADVEIDKLRGGPQAYRVPGMMIRRNEMAGWAAYAEDRPDEALDLLRKAADQQDKLGQNEVDIPAREMLGDLLMALHRPKDALVEYKVALTLSPNRLNGLLSAGQAAEASGDKEAAAMYYADAAHNTRNAVDSKRPPLLYAVNFAAREPAQRTAAE
jgi:tetratricopeptide (TPR) repeat protein